MMTCGDVQRLSTVWQRLKLTISFLRVQHVIVHHVSIADCYLLAIKQWQTIEMEDREMKGMTEKSSRKLGAKTH